MVAPTSATATEGRRRDRVLSNYLRNADRRRLPRVIIIDPLDLSPSAAAAVRQLSEHWLSSRARLSCATLSTAIYFRPYTA